MKGFFVKLLVICLGILGLLKALETRLTFPLDPTPVTAAEVGLRDVTVLPLAPKDGVDVFAWLHSPPKDAPLIVYFQGNAGHLGHRAERFLRFSRHGFGWAALAYRGAGGAGGVASEATLMADATLLINALKARFPNRPLIYYGESLGTGVAAQLAVTHPPAKLVLEAPYTSIPDAAIHGQAPASVAALFENQFNTLEHISQVRSQLLILHGTLDKTIPIAQGEAVFEAAASPDKTLLRLKGIGHGDVWTSAVQRKLWQFFRSP